MATMGSPTKRTVSFDNHGRVIIGGGNSGTIAVSGANSATSGAMNTPRTPGIDRAALTSMPATLAWATVART